MTDGERVQRIREAVKRYDSEMNGVVTKLPPGPGRDESALRVVANFFASLREILR